MPFFLSSLNPSSVHSSTFDGPRSPLLELSSVALLSSTHILVSALAWFLHSTVFATRFHKHDNGRNKLTLQENGHQSDPCKQQNTPASTSALQPLSFSSSAERSPMSIWFFSTIWLSPLLLPRTFLGSKNCSRSTARTTSEEDLTEFLTASTAPTANTKNKPNHQDFAAVSRSTTPPPRVVAISSNDSSCSSETMTSNEEETEQEEQDGRLTIEGSEIIIPRKLLNDEKHTLSFHTDSVIFDAMSMKQTMREVAPLEPMMVPDLTEASEKIDIPVAKQLSEHVSTETKQEQSADSTIEDMEGVMIQDNSDETTMSTSPGDMQQMSVNGKENGNNNNEEKHLDPNLLNRMNVVKHLTPRQDSNLEKQNEKETKKYTIITRKRNRVFPLFQRRHSKDQSITSSSSSSSDDGTITTQETHQDNHHDHNIKKVISLSLLFPFLNITDSVRKGERRTKNCCRKSTNDLKTTASVLPKGALVDHDKRRKSIQVLRELSFLSFEEFGPENR